MTRWIPIFVLLALAACSSREVTELYRAERAMFHKERELRALEDLGLPMDPARLRTLATDFEGIAAAIPSGSSPAIREIEGRAWLRAVQCHFALVDSGRAEIILATLATEFGDLPAIFGEVSLGLGRVTEHHGQYRAALNHYREVTRVVVPDPGFDPKSPPDPEARPEEKTADDFVLELPLRMARLAARDTTVVDPSRFYAEAHDYYAARVDDPSPFVRIDSTVLLADLLADLGRWREASLILDAIEDRIPGVVQSRHAPSAIRLASFEYQAQALTFGAASADSVRGLLDQLVDDYPMGDATPSALYAWAQAATALGDHEQAHHDLTRLARDYPTAPVVPAARLLHARLYAEEEDWMEARRLLRSLPLEFPTSGAALRAPLEIAAFYRELGDEAGELFALKRAEEQYREIIERYPTGTHSFDAWQNLVTVLELQGRFAEAVDGLLAMCDRMAQPWQRPGLLQMAARRSEERLGEPARAADILERLGEEFPNTRLGRAAVRDAYRLRAAQGR